MNNSLVEYQIHIEKNPEIWSFSTDYALKSEGKELMFNESLPVIIHSVLQC